MAASTKDIARQVRELLGLILNRSIGEQENPSRDTEPAWDSLKHVELMFLLEDTFGVRFRDHDLRDLHDCQGVVRAIEMLLGEGVACATTS